MTVSEELIKIVGAENVQDDQDTLEEYSKDESFVRPVRPRCVVRPAGLEEVRGIVNWANETKTPLIPVSSGAPRFRGDTVPTMGGTVIIDMSRMNKIIRIDRRNKVFMVEPGVTYGELIPELAKEGLAPFLPLSPRATKSVVGSLLEREPITMPRYHWDMQDPLMCMEVVFGNGEYFRTGSAAGPGDLEEQWKAGKAQCRPYGPSYTDFAKVVQGTQGSLGIVTWLSVLARPLPELKQSYLVPSDNMDRVIDLMYKIIWKRIGQDTMIMNGAYLARLISEDEKSARELQKELPQWVLIFSVEGYGALPEERLEYQEADFMEAAQEYGLEPTKVLAKVRANRLTQILDSPSDEPYWKIRAKGGNHDIFFRTLLDQTPSFLDKMIDLAVAQKYPVNDIGVYIQPVVFGTSYHCEFSLPFDPESLEEKAMLKTLDENAAKSFAGMGAFFCRPYGQWAQYAYTNAADTVMLQRKVKNILFDQNGIMNPGKLCFA